MGYLQFGMECRMQHSTAAGFPPGQSPFEGKPNQNQINEMQNAGAAEFPPGPSPFEARTYELGDCKVTFRGYLGEKVHLKA